MALPFFNQFDHVISKAFFAPYSSIMQSDVIDLGFTMNEKKRFSELIHFKRLLVFLCESERYLKSVSETVHQFRIGFLYS